LRFLRCLRVLRTYRSMHVFRLNTAPTRGHSLKLIKPRCHLDVRKYSFAHCRVIDIWKSSKVQLHVIQHSINGLKGRIDKFVYNRGFLDSMKEPSSLILYRDWTIATLFYGDPIEVVSKLQRLQNNVARIVLKADQRYVMPVCCCDNFIGCPSKVDCVSKLHY